MALSMLNMSTLYERLLEVCVDQGIKRPRGVHIQAIASLSSGRITQIKNEGEAARLGVKTLQKLARLGYLADWLQEGRGEKKRADSPAFAALETDGRATAIEARDAAAVQWPPTARERRIAEINALLARTDDYGIVAVLEKAKDVAREYPLQAQKTA